MGGALTGYCLSGRCPYWNLSLRADSLLGAVHSGTVMKIGRDAFLYMDPVKVDPDDFAQCGTCMHFAADDERCTLLPKDFVVDAGDSCGMYLPGPTAPDTAEALELFSPQEVGFVRREVRCENCMFFSVGSQCGLYLRLNRELPDLFALDPTVQAQGCCNAQTPKSVTSWI